MKINLTKYVRHARQNTRALLVFVPVVELESCLAVVVVRDGELPTELVPGDQPCGDATYHGGELHVDTSLVVPGWTVFSCSLVADPTTVTEALSLRLSQARKSVEAGAQEVSEKIRKRLVARSGLIEHTDAS